jgi:hypothetical protein
MTEKIVPLIPCPPLSLYSEQPKDQSLFTLEDCPSCKNLMWISEKKKAMIEIATILNVECKVLCYLYLEKEAKENPDIFIERKMVNL